jgi:hypothetical protein
MRLVPRSFLLYRVATGRPGGVTGIRGEDASTEVDTLPFMSDGGLVQRT